MEFDDDIATLSLNVDKNSKIPIYQQITQQLRQMINESRLMPNERLPSSRKLAQILYVSRTSALNAYEQLIAEGLLLSRPGSGIFVSQLSNLPQLVEEPTTPIEHVTTTSVNKGVFDSGPDVEGFPSQDWLRSLTRVWRKPDPSLLRGNHPGGYWSLRQTVAQYIKALRGINCLPEQVIITAGNRDALVLICQVLLQKNNLVGLENPCYPPLRQGLISQGAKLLECEIDQEGIQTPQSKVNLAWMTPARQYPLGISMSTKRRLEWLEYSRQHQTWLIEDDYDSEFQYRKTPMSPLYHLVSRLPVPEQRLILVGSLSKVMFRTLRIGYMIVPKILIAPILKIQESLGNMASVPIQPALADFLGHRRFVSHLRRMRTLYRHRRDFLFHLVQQKLGQFMTAELPEGGMHLLIYFRLEKNIDDIWLEQQLKAIGINVHALSKHYDTSTNDGQNNNSGLVLGFSGSTDDKLEYGVNQILHLLNPFLLS